MSKPVLQQFEVTIGVIVSAETMEDALEIAEQSVDEHAATVMTVQLANLSRLSPARAREAAIANRGSEND